MKKILTLALASLAVCSVNAQKANLDAAKKLAGKIDKVEEARALLKAAKENPETAEDPYTYFLAGKVEFDAYDNANMKRMINPNDKDVNPLNMANQIVNGYQNMLEVMPRDKQPNAKGEIKPKYTKDAIKALNTHFNDYFNAGGTLYNEQQYYPGAYQAFYIFGTFPKSEYADKKIAATPDSTLNQALFNAGISAYAGNAVPEAANAFKLARLNDTNNEQNYIYEIACWQYMMQNDSTKTDEGKKEIDAIAKAGYEKFGMDQPVFLNNLVNSYVMDNNMQAALELVEGQVAKTPDVPNLYGLLGFIYDRMDKDDQSVENYRKAAAMPNVDAETLKNVSKKLFRVGVAKREAMDPKDAAAKQAIKADYFEAAKAAAEKAKTISPETTKDLDYVIENIDYALEQYFN
ncbi:MAG: hypothetical protein K2J23_03605 [Muribaculaceae bacterium]|nr:hypothetical protein [Muribaculaceae bacterium]